MVFLLVAFNAKYQACRLPFPYCRSMLPLLSCCDVIIVCGPGFRALFSSGWPTTVHLHGLKLLLQELDAERGLLVGLVIDLLPCFIDIQIQGGISLTCRCNLLFLCVLIKTSDGRSCLKDKKKSIDRSPTSTRLIVTESYICMNVRCSEDGCWTNFLPVWV